MRVFTRSLLATALALLASGAWAQVSVNYVKPEQFSDMPFSVVDRERVLKALSEHFAKLGEKLPAGQSLKIDVLDVDLAGREIPRARSGEDIRVMKGGADWPRMHLHYTLEQNGQVLRSGDDDLADMNYQDHINPYSSGDPLRYEKQMVDQWFNKQFVPRKAG